MTLNTRNSGMETPPSNINHVNMAYRYSAYYAGFYSHHQPPSTVLHTSSVHHDCLTTHTATTGEWHHKAHTTLPHTHIMEERPRCSRIIGIRDGFTEWHGCSLAMVGQAVGCTAHVVIMVAASRLFFFACPPLFSAITPAAAAHRPPSPPPPALHRPARLDKR